MARRANIAKETRRWIPGDGARFCTGPLPQSARHYHGGETGRTLRLRDGMRISWADAIGDKTVLVWLQGKPDAPAVVVIVPSKGDSIVRELTSASSLPDAIGKAKAKMTELRREYVEREHHVLATTTRAVDDAWLRRQLATLDAG